MGGHVFISYGQADKPFVEQLADLLNAAGIPVWYDDRAEQDRRTVEQQIDTCAAFVVVMSPEARATDRVHTELEWAYRRAKDVLPILLRGEPFLRLMMVPHEDLRAAGLPGQRWVDDVRRRIPPPRDGFEGNLLHTLAAHQGQAMSVAFASGNDGRHVASAGTDNTAKVWDTMTGTCRLTIPTVTWPVALSADGLLIATGSAAFAVQLWAPDGSHVRTIAQHTDALQSIAISPDATVLATGSKDKTQRLWDLRTGEPLHTLTGRVDPGSPLVFSPDGSWLVAPDTAGANSASLWDVRTGAIVRTLSGHRGPVRDVTVSADGRLVATASDDRTVLVWDTTSGRPVRRLDLHTMPVHSVAFSPQSYRLASASTDGSIRLWDAATGAHLKLVTSRSGVVNDLAFSPDGITIVTANPNGTLHLWHA